MCEVDFEPIGKRVFVPTQTSLLEAARQAGIALSSTCGGQGNCGQCRIQVLAGEVSPPRPEEDFVFTEPELLDGHRLACCTEVLGDVKLHIPTGTLLTNSRLQIDSAIHGVPVDAAIQAYHIEAAPPSLADLRADVERIAQAIGSLGGRGWISAEPAVVRQVSGLARQEQWRLAAYVRDGELVGLAPYGLPPLGMAVDLGTTKIAAFLLNLQTGEELAAAGALNPQIGYGEDVISRLNYARRNPDGPEVMATAISATLDDLLGRLIQAADADRRQVAEVCIVGNTAMTHLLLRLPIGQLVSAPYVSALSAALDVKARDVGLETAPGAYVHLLPGIGGFVGADHVAMVLATDMDRVKGVTIGLDIGTNTEISLAKPGGQFLSAVSCASGPAFEGAHISDGMRAAAGAIEAVRIGPEGIQLKTIDDAPPIGLCGSGIVDVMAELRRNAIINFRGRFDKTDHRVRTGRFGPEILLASTPQTGSGRDVVISQEDVNAIQLAKGAIRAGLEALMQATDTAPEDVGEIIIAGAFGSFLNLQSALDTGLLPHYPRARYRQVGNAAGVGAKWALISRAERKRASEIAQNTRYIELTSYPRFGRLFALGMLFPEDADLSRHSPSTE